MSTELIRFDATISDRDAPRRIKAAVLEAFGRLDILINNAGGSRPIKGGLGTPEEWEEGMRLNFDAGRNLAHTFIESMQTQKFGRIINLTGTQEPLGFNAAKTEHRPSRSISLHSNASLLQLK